MRRDAATLRIVALLERVSGGGDVYLDAVEEVSVFGSYAAGALAPNDVDLAVGYSDSTGQIGIERVERMFAGKNLETPFAQALRGRQRGLNIVFNVRETLERQGGFEFVTLWRRGDSLELALERLRSIRINPKAGSAPREYVHPAIAGFEKRVPIDARKELIELERHGRVRIRRLEIERDLEPKDGKLRRMGGSGYSKSSPRRRATGALLAQLEADGVPIKYDVRGVILSQDLQDTPFATVQHGAERLGRALDDALYGRSGRSYCVLNLTDGAPFTILEIEACSAAREVRADADHDGSPS